MKNTEEIRELLTRYQDGRSTLEEEEILLHYFLNEEVPDELESYKAEFLLYHEEQQVVADTASLDKLLHLRRHFKFSDVLKIAAVITIAIGSFFLGYGLNVKSNVEQQLTALQDEVSILKETAVLAMLQTEASHQKIEAIFLASQLSAPSEELLKKITGEFKMNSNPIVQNVAIEFLQPHIDHPYVQSHLLQILTEKPFETIQLETFEILSKSSNPKVLETLKELISSDKIDADIRSQLEEVLSNNHSRS